MLRRLWCEQEENRNCFQTFYSEATSMVHCYTLHHDGRIHQLSKIKEYLALARTAPGVTTTTHCESSRRTEDGAK